MIDCNRDPGSAAAVPEVSDGTVIHGNLGLSPAARAARVRAIHEPYQQMIADEIARRDAAGRATILVSLHSFTPSLAGSVRPWQIGVLHDGANDRFALKLLETLAARPGLVVGDNEPYRMDGTDHSVPRHAFAALRPYVELEVRQDLLADSAGQALWSLLVADALRAAA